MINPHPVLPKFEYIRPQNAREAVQFLRDHPAHARPLLGGTDCLIGVRDRKIEVQYLVDLKHLDGFDQLAFDAKKGLTVGAAVNLNALIAHEETCSIFSLITDAAREVGSYQLRSRATMVGNICNASPCGDTIAPCLVYDAILTVLGPDGERQIPIMDFFTGPGATVLQVGEIVRSIHLPIPPAGAIGCYKSIGRNKIGDLAIAAVTVLGYPSTKTRSGYVFKLALTAVAPTVIFVEEAQDLLADSPINKAALEKAAQIAADTCKPIDDIRATARYRREMIKTLTQQALQEVWAELNG